MPTLVRILRNFFVNINDVFFFYILSSTVPLYFYGAYRELSQTYCIPLDFQSNQFEYLRLPIVLIQFYKLK